MKSSHVLTTFYEIPNHGISLRVDRLRLLVNVSSGERTRVLALSWLPGTEYTAVGQTCGIDLYNGLPTGKISGGDIANSVTERLAYRTLDRSPTVDGFFSTLNSLVYVFPEMPSDGLLFTDAIYVVGRGTPAIGASAVFITYQSG